MEELERIFDNNSDCYTSVFDEEEGWIDDVPAMTKETFVKLVKEYHESKISNLYNSKIFPLEKVTRLEVIDENGRSYVNWNKRNIIALSFQDEERTLKIFISKENDN